jgi:hypothetical protein
MRTEAYIIIPYMFSAVCLGVYALYREDKKLSVDRSYVYIIIEESAEKTELVPDKPGTKTIRAYLTEEDAEEALDRFKHGHILRIDLNDGDII